MPPLLACLFGTIRYGFFAPWILVLIPYFAKSTHWGWRHKTNTYSRLISLKLAGWTPQYLHIKFKNLIKISSGVSEICCDRVKSWGAHLFKQARLFSELWSMSEGSLPQMLNFMRILTISAKLSLTLEHLTWTQVTDISEKKNFCLRKKLRHSDDWLLGMKESICWFYLYQSGQQIGSFHLGAGTWSSQSAVRAAVVLSSVELCWSKCWTRNLCYIP